MMSNNSENNQTLVHNFSQELIDTRNSIVKEKVLACQTANGQLDYDKLADSLPYIDLGQLVALASDLDYYGVDDHEYPHLMAAIRHHELGGYDVYDFLTHNNYFGFGMDGVYAYQDCLDLLERSLS